MKKHTSIILILLHLIFGIAYTQSNHGIGVASGGVYLADDKIVAPGILLQYDYNLPLKTEGFSLEAAIENVFTDERHFAFGIGLGYNLYKNFDISLGPGIVFHGNDLLYMIHSGISYDVISGKYSLGPMFEYSYIGKYSHYMLGLSFGIQL